VPEAVQIRRDGGYGGNDDGLIDRGKKDAKQDATQDFQDLLVGELMRVGEILHVRRWHELVPLYRRPVVRT
jgi:hypothetical protein